MICYNFMLSTTMQTFCWENSHNQLQHLHRMFSLFKSTLSYFHTGEEKDKKKYHKWEVVHLPLWLVLITGRWYSGYGQMAEQLLGVQWSRQCQVEPPGFLLAETLGYAHNNSGALIPAEVVMLLPPSPLYEHYLEIFRGTWCDTVVLTVIFSLLIKIEVITLDE